MPGGPERAALARGDPVVLADGRPVTPEMVQGPNVAGAKLAIVGDAEEIISLIEPVRRADVLVIEATFLERDVGLARERGHLVAAAAAKLACEAEAEELLLTHISRPLQGRGDPVGSRPPFPEGADRRRFRPRLGLSSDQFLSMPACNVAVLYSIMRI